MEVAFFVAVFVLVAGFIGYAFGRQSRIKECETIRHEVEAARREAHRLYRESMAFVRASQRSKTETAAGEPVKLADLSPWAVLAGNDYLAKDDAENTGA